MEVSQRITENNLKEKREETPKKHGSFTVGWYHTSQQQRRITWRIRQAILAINQEEFSLANSPSNYSY